MRYILFLLMLLPDKLSFSQSPTNSNIQKGHTDSLDHIVYRLKDSLRRIQYENNVFKNCHSVDNSNFGTDSVVIYYKSKTGSLLKKYTKTNLQSDSQYAYEKIEYLNSEERPEFIEHWELARSSDHENAGVFTWKVYSYERFGYDNLGRMKTWIKFYPAVSRRTARRIIYQYETDGTQISSTDRIEIEKFWD